MDPVVAELTWVVRAVGALEPDTLLDEETLVALSRASSVLDAVLATATAAFESSGEYRADGSRSVVAWTASHCHLSRRDAQRRVRLGRACRELPGFADAFRAGDLSAAHLEVAAAAAPGPEAARAMVRDEEMLVSQAKALEFSEYRRAMAYWSQLADPDGIEERAEAQRARRDVVLAQSFEGTYFGRMTLDPISGTIVSTALTRIEAELFEADWAQAKERLGRDPIGSELRRTAPQRRADALVVMAERASVVGVGAVVPKPLLSVLVGYETLHGRILELANGTVVTPGSLLPYLEQSMIERAVFTPAGRVEVSEKARLFSGATRRAIELRDRRCVAPGCEISAEHCQVDHIVPYARGGLTTQENGRLLCPAHNRARSDHGACWETRCALGRMGDQPLAGQRSPPRE